MPGLQRGAIGCESPPAGGTALSAIRAVGAQFACAVGGTVAAVVAFAIRIEQARVRTQRAWTVAGTGGAIDGRRAWRACVPRHRRWEHLGAWAAIGAIKAERATGVVGPCAAVVTVAVRQVVTAVLKVVANCPDRRRLHGWRRATAYCAAHERARTAIAAIGADWACCPGRSRTTIVALPIIQKWAAIGVICAEISRTRRCLWHW